MQYRWRQKNRAMGFGSHSFFVWVFNAACFSVLEVVFCGSISRFYRANSGFNGVGGNLIVHGWKVAVWAEYCVVRHRILGWLVE